MGRHHMNFLFEFTNRHLNLASYISYDTLEAHIVNLISLHDRISLQNLPSVFECPCIMLLSDSTYTHLAAYLYHVIQFLPYHLVDKCADLPFQNQYCFSAMCNWSTMCCQSGAWTFGGLMFGMDVHVVLNDLYSVGCVSCHLWGSRSS